MYYKRWQQNLVGFLCILALILLCYLTILAAHAYGLEDQHGNVRQPVSPDANCVVNIALDAAGTYYPTPRIKAAGWENGDHSVVWNDSDDFRLDFYEFLLDEFIEPHSPGTARASCTQAVCAVLAPIDNDVWMGADGPQDFISYCAAHPERYDSLGRMAASELRPGDIMCSPSHTAIYIGHKASGGLGDTFEAGYTTYDYPGITTWSLGPQSLGQLEPWSDYIVFRIK